MFQNILTPDGIPKIKPQRYTVASFSAIIAFFRERVNVKWAQFVSRLIQEIETRPGTAEVRQEVLTYFHLHGIQKLPSPRIQKPKKSSLGSASILLRRTPPAVVALVVTVPRQAFPFVSNILAPANKPTPGHFDIRVIDPRSTVEHRFSCLHPVFGKLITYGDAPNATVIEDPAGWSGQSELQLWCYFPTQLFLDLKDNNTELVVGFVLAEDMVEIKGGIETDAFELMRTHLHNQDVNVFESLPGLAPPQFMFDKHGSEAHLLVNNDMIRVGVPRLAVHRGFAFQTRLTVLRRQDLRLTGSRNDRAAISPFPSMDDQPGSLSISMSGTAIMM